MVEFFTRWLPVDEAKIFTVVFRVAARAILVRVVPLDHRRVKALIHGETLIDFSVTVEAFQSSATAKFVTTGTLRHPGY
jgi:hypothetical protein